jgi:CHAD domain-containing protein
MSFSFKRGDGTIEEQVRRIAAAQVDAALKEARMNGLEIGERVHRLRRRCKKLRGLLQLIQPVFKDAQTENRAFRDAAARLSGTRDAMVMVETLDGLAAGDEAIPAELHKALRAALSPSDQNGGSEDDAEAMLAQFGKAMGAARGRVDGWKLGKQGFTGLQPGLRRTYRRMRSCMDAAARTGTAAHFHEWRKQVKYHWHHISLLEACAPDVLEGQRALLNRLGELLGDHHNLAVFDQRLAEDPALAALGDLGPLRNKAAARQESLAAEALRLGRQLAAEKPDALSDRFGQYWALARD